MQAINETPDFLSSLLKYLKRHIGLYLDKGSLARLGQCSKHWKHLVEELYIQKPLLHGNLSLLDIVPWPLIEHEGYLFNFEEDSVSGYNQRAPYPHEIILLRTPEGLRLKTLDLNNKIVEAVIDQHNFPKDYLTTLTARTIENQLSLYRFIIAEMTHLGHITYKGPPFFHECSGHTGKINQIIRMSDRLALTCSEDKTIKLWDSWARKCLYTFIGHDSPVKTLLKISDTQFISAAQDGSLLLWNRENLKTQSEFNKIKRPPTFFNMYPDEIDKLLLLPNNQFVCAYADGRLEVWCITSRKRLKQLSPDPTRASPLCLALAADNTIILVSASTYTRLQLEQTIITYIPTPEEIYCATLLSSGILALGAIRQIYFIDLAKGNTFTIGFPKYPEQMIEYPKGCLLISTYFNMLIYAVEKRELINFFKIERKWGGSQQTLTMLSEAEVAHSINNQTSFEIIRFSSQKQGFFNPKKPFLPETKNSACIIC